MSDNLIEIRDLAVEFVTGDQAQRVVEGVSFDIRKGETLALVGESGSGKSVTAHSILRLLPYPLARHPAGSVHYQGQDLLQANEKTLRGIRGNRIAQVVDQVRAGQGTLGKLVYDDELHDSATAWFGGETARGGFWRLLGRTITFFAPPLPARTDESSAPPAGQPPRERD